MQVFQFASFCIECPFHYSPPEKALGFSSYLLLLNTSHLPHFSLKAVDLTQRETLQNKRKCLLEILFYHIAQMPENTWKNA